EIDAFVRAISLSAALTFKGSGTAVAIGVSIARNLIGWEEFGGADPLTVEASVSDTDDDGDTSLLAERGISVTADSTSRIDATVAAAAVAVSMSSKSSLAATAAGVFAQNSMAADVHAFIDGAAQVDTGGGDLVVTAEDHSTVT